MFNRLVSIIADWIEIKILRLKRKSKPVLKIVESMPSRYDRVAIIVGHTRKSQGATTYDGQSEYIWNDRVAKAITRLVQDKQVKIFYRDGIGRKGVAKKAAAWAGDNSASLELHFNAFSGTAYGTSCLALEYDDDSIDLARKCSQAISDKFKTKLRNTNGVKLMKSNGRGGMNLQYCRNEGIESSILLEPFFGNKKTHESERFIEGSGWMHYAECIAEFIDSI